MQFVQAVRAHQADPEIDRMSTEMKAKFMPAAAMNMKMPGM